METQNDLIENQDSKRFLRKTRVKFGVANLLYNGDESAFSPFHTAIIRDLGGGDAHLGFIGGAMQSMGPLFTWFGAVLLRWMKFNRQAMMLALAIGALIQAAIVIMLVAVSQNAGWANYVLYGYLSLITLMSMMTGGQQNIAISWIGDLVQPRLRGRFVSGMSIVSNIGLIILQLSFARLAVVATGFYAYAGLMGLLCLNTFISILLFWTVPNCQSKAVKFITTHKEERVNYRYRPLWLLVWFECAWRGGRVAMMAFVTAYMIDQFGMAMSRIILIHMMVNVVNILMLYLMGTLSDRVGPRRPLMVISAVCATSMLLWVSTAWWGVWPVFAYQLINGAAGSTHWMLVRNLSLDVYPARGRPNFLSFSQTLVGLFLMVSTTGAGYLMAGMRGWSVMFMGAEINHYHVFFLGCTAVTLTCLFPLGLLGRHMLSAFYIQPSEEDIISTDPKGT